MCFYSALKKCDPQDVNWVPDGKKKYKALRPHFKTFCEAATKYWMTLIHIENLNTDRA